MAKHTLKYICSSCSYVTVRWLGCCPTCNQWNSFEEEKLEQPSPLLNKNKSENIISMRSLKDVSMTSQDRLKSGISEFDNVLGGGIMPGSLIILTGDPGIGKSTLLLHVANKLAKNYSVFYFSSEESLEQVKLRAQRIGKIEDNLLFSDQANIEQIISTASHNKPDCIIIDSIQNCFMSQANSCPGTISQLRETSYALMRLAKEQSISIIMTCHITKEGQMAGPKTVEHMVDAVFYLQGEDKWNTRILRSVKNRFGPICELGFFSMTEKGLEEIHHINQYFLSDHTNAPGSVLVSCLEGTRPLILEVQALIIPSKYGVPQRVITGLDHKRVVLIAAILEKYLQIKFSGHDIFVQISGGMKVTESSCDLGIALALLSSYFQQSLPDKSMALAEMSLTGAIKPINNADSYLHEANKFGLKQVYVSGLQKTNNKIAIKMQNVYQLLSLFNVDQQ